jgi:hypothetical protein
MGAKPKVKAEVFLDAAYAIALSVPKDSYHERAVLLADELEAAETHMVTTHAVMLEIAHFQQAGLRALLLEDSR